MRKFLMATHGKFASGIKTSLEIIAGTCDQVYTIDAYMEDNKSVETEFLQVLSQISNEDELIVFTDLAGGSITNQILQNALKPNVYVVAGVNLPLLIDVVLANSEIPTAEVIDAAILNAREQIFDVKQFFNS
jgi:fructoselysine and glucoselysine-specific PTS system IIA component